MQKQKNVPYGNNSEVGQYITINGAKLYVMTYGEGEPLLLIHGNSGSITSMEHQIDFFKDNYQVVVIDNRGHGKSELQTDSLTYDQITADYEALLSKLQLNSINIVGWSDGGIVALQLGISGKTPVKKLVAMSANLRPDSTAVHEWAIHHDEGTLKDIKAKIKQNDTTENWDL